VACAAATLMAGILTTSGAGRFAAVDAAVRSSATITVGESASATAVTVHPPPRLPERMVARVAAVPGVARAVGDIAFPVTAFDSQGRVLSARGADRTEAHGWSSAALTPYSLVAGHPPLDAEQVVLDARLADHDGLRVSEHVRIVTPAGGREFRISGIATSDGRGDPGQSALFFSDPAARQLGGASGQVNAVAVFSPPGVGSSALQSRSVGRWGRG